MTLALRTLSEHRSFEATVLGLVMAQPFMPSTDKEMRPAMVTFACSAQVYRPFVANIAEKRALELHYYSGSKVEAHPFGLLKSAGYDLAAQVIPGREGHDEMGNPTREPDKVVGTYYLTNAFALEPATTESERCDFIMLPTREQLEANAASLDNRSIVTHLLRTGRSKLPAEMLRYFGALACLWAGYVDRRVHAPIIQEPAFFAHALYDAMDKGYVRVSKPLDPTRPANRERYGWRDKDVFPQANDDFRVYGLESLGFATPALICQASEEQMQNLLAESIKSYSTVVQCASGTITLPEGL